MIGNLLNAIGSSQKRKELEATVAEYASVKAEIDKARCIVELNAEGTITHINRNMQQALGYTEADVLNQHHRILVGRADANSDAYQAFWRGLDSCQTQIGEFKLQDKEGNAVWFQGYYAAVPDNQGKLRKIVAYLTDTTRTHGNIDSIENELARMKQALNNASIAIMSVDRDFKVNYLNEGTKALLNMYLTDLRKFFPTLDPDNMMGTCIDMFHRNPKHQRDLLADPKNLPHTTHIKLGDLYIRLHVTAAYDAAGNYCGNILEWREVTKELSDKGRMDALFKVMGIIEFDLTGKIIDVNDNFANVTGYSKAEIIGQHHSMFVDPTYKTSSEYKAFWDKLGRGELEVGQFKRFGKGGKQVWLEASYNPVFDANGKPYKVIKYATDITKAKIQSADYQGQIEAISKAMGVIEFDLKGNILAVNESFANVTGYSQSEIVGKHHSMFVEPTYKNSAEYRMFWEKLGSGIADVGQYHRVGKGGRDVWLQASYNPILDPDGKPYKVVKFATDITEQHNAAVALEVAVKESQNVIEQAKLGDLSNRVSLQGKTGAIAALCDGVNAIMDRMSEVVLQVKEAGETINTAAGEIATGNNDLSSRTEQQASSLEETASSMEELAATVKQNADNAKQANQLAAAASGVAVKGGEVVGRVVETMSAINDSAKKIEDIISVIDGIAFQTNILALNAAVEAARAGEQGRGFAVVAGEVRNLAQRSASAAKEIKELITDSVSKTAEGTGQVESAGKTMEEIVASVQRVTDIMGEISAASNEQSSGISQVNTAIASMDEVTQQNAALVEQAAAAAESLVEQAATLMDTVNAFKLNGVAATAERRAPNSPMRVSAPAAKPASRPVYSKPIAKPTSKTGTDDGEWEEF